MAQFFIRRIKEGPTSWEIAEAHRGREKGRRVVFYTEENTALCVEVLEVTENFRNHRQVSIRAKEQRKTFGTDELTIWYDMVRMRGNVYPLIP